MEVKKILTKYNIKPRRRLGQNFLVSQKYLRKIVEYLPLTPQDTVLEIGAGVGNLTELLLEKTSRVIAVELDGVLTSVLAELLGQNKKLEILHRDFLKVDIKNISASLKIVGNPPYYFASRLIEKLITDRAYFSCAYLSLQREYVERMLAVPGSKKYGRLSVFVQSFFECEELFKIPRSAFYPPPDVDSVFISLIPKKNINIDSNILEAITRDFFSKRRKKLSSIIKNSKLSIPSEMERMLKNLDIDINHRPEVIPVEKFHKMVEILKGKER